jgi:nucleotide-binding universal stress UspA family protein
MFRGEVSMLQKILFPLGGNEKFNEIKSFFASMVSKRRFALQGLGVVDIEGIEDSLSGAPPGAIGIAEEAAKKVLTNEKERLRDFVGSLGKNLDSKKVDYAWKVTERNPRDEILKRTIGPDLLVLHSESVFSYSKEREPTSFFADVIARSQIPVLYLSGEKPHGDIIGLASDFGKDANHALYSFLHLGIFSKSKIIFSHVSAEEGPQKRFAPYQDYFKLHGFENVVEVNLKGEKDSALRRFVETEKIGLLILGKKGESKLKDYLFGTLTNALIDKPACSLFIHD